MDGDDACTHQLSRAELYDRVWTTPMRTLAAEFGSSDVGLLKLCHRHQVPTPPRGYWAIGPRAPSGRPPAHYALRRYGATGGVVDALRPGSGRIPPLKTLSSAHAGGRHRRRAGSASIPQNG